MEGEHIEDLGADGLITLKRYSRSELFYGRGKRLTCVNTIINHPVP
jgi:hypothetical protein